MNSILADKHNEPINKCRLKLQACEARFHNIIKKSADGLIILDKKYVIHFVNPAAELLFGRKAEELIGKLFGFPIVIGEKTEIEVITKSNKLHFAEMSIIETEWEGEVAYLASIHDITERKQGEEKINQSYQIQNVISSVLKISLKPISFEEQLEHILDLLLSISWIALQSKGCIYFVEENAEMLVMKAHRNLTKKQETTCAKIPFGKCLCGRAAISHEIVFAAHIDDRHDICYQGILPHGHYCVPIILDSQLLGVINLYVKEGHKRDQREDDFLYAVADTIAGIIDRRKTELEKEQLKEKLMHSEKLSALGRLTANVAHEIRNPLAALGGFSRRLGKKITDGTIEKDYCEIIISEVERLEKILRSILTFSTDVSLKIKEHNINNIVNESLKEYEVICKKLSINMQKSFGDIPEIRIDREQIRQVINNLISNAIDSMPKGGTLTVATHKEFLNGIIYAVLKITDEGEGIPEDKLHKLFEPFFTTKAIKQFYGTGLGLSISRKIMEEHCGFIKAESRVGEGSTFSLYFPYQSEKESSKVKCWQYLKCGRDCNTDTGCPAYPYYGRSCWVIAGTYCGGKRQGTFAEKIEDCKRCPFYQKVVKSKKD